MAKQKLPRGCPTDSLEEAGALRNSEIPGSPPIRLVLKITPRKMARQEIDLLSQTFRSKRPVL